METTVYEDFAKGCIENLKKMQSKMQHDFDIDMYDNWYYNQSTALLTFSKDDKELNFRYFSVGTFSRNSNTWKWAWDNNNTLDNIKEPSVAVREFGIKSGFQKLTNGYFATDEIDAWEFAAIAAKLTDGIGVYRPVSENLLIFMVITEFVDTETAQLIKDKYIHCNKHEDQRVAFVCQHLNSHTKVGFNEAFETTPGMELYDDDDLQAWCDDCEQYRLAEGEWNDNSMFYAAIKLVCENCYFEMKELNLKHQ